MAGEIKSRTETYDNLITSTWYDIRKSIIDSIFTITPYWDRMIEAGRIKAKVPDGTRFEIPYRTGKQDQNIQYFGRGGKFSRAEKETMTRLYYQVRNVGTSVVRFWDDDRKNRGRSQIINYVNEIVENTKISLIDQLAKDVLVTNSDPLSIMALDEILPENPTASATIGGLDRSTASWLQNQYEDFNGGSYVMADDLINRMRIMYNNCSKLKNITGRRTPDLILTTQAIHEELESQAEDMREIHTTTSQRVQFGMGNLSFKTAEIFWDPNMTAGSMYFLNTSTLELDYDPQAWFEMTGWKGDPDSLDRTAQVVSVCEQVCTNFPANGVLFNVQ